MDKQYHYYHWRYDRKGNLRRYFRGKSKWTPNGCGGRTLCVVMVDGRAWGMGEAICFLGENFCYAQMRKEARAGADREINIRYVHFRYTSSGRLKMWNMDWDPEPYGGHTLCIIETASGLSAVGESSCDVHDLFDVSQGMKQARERAEREIWYVDDLQEEEELLVDERCRFCEKDCSDCGE